MISRKPGSLPGLDLRRSWARLCHGAGGELEQIQIQLGNVSAQPRRKYLGYKRRFKEAANDETGIKLACVAVPGQVVDKLVRDIV
jgi:hypothetical protein